MNKAPIAVLLGLGLLAGCVPTTQVGMKLENYDNPPTTLIGNFVDDKTQRLSVSDGDLTCSGIAAPRSRMWKSQTLSFPNIICSDGRTGLINLNVTLEMDRGITKISGVGVGKLSDGTKVKVMMGDMTVMMSW